MPGQEDVRPKQEARLTHQHHVPHKAVHHVHPQNANVSAEDFSSDTAVSDLQGDSRLAELMDGTKENSPPTVSRALDFQQSLPKVAQAITNGTTNGVDHSTTTGPDANFKSKSSTNVPSSTPPTSSSTAHRFPRISRPVELLRHEYDCVVIGSGYGGGVAASRMARAGQSVCVLERGSERWPGEYPVTPLEAFPQLHVSGNFSPKEAGSLPVNDWNPTGLYHLIMGEGQNAFVANGLGGTSLLNANVFLEMDPKTNALGVWPAELRDPKVLEPYYKRAASVLQPEAYPAGYPRLPKLDLLEKQRDALGFGKFYRVPQTTRFESGPNSTGVQMNASTLSGQDCTGINDGSKQTTLVTYLTDAWNWGAEIFCECEVRYISKCETSGYNVFFAWHGAKRGKFRDYLYTDLMWVHAKELVFLGAGTLGTSEILLRSKEEGLEMSDTVGTNISGNGDILAFGYNTDAYTGSMGRERPRADAPCGPTITGIIDCRDQEDAMDGFVIEEGAVPQALAGFYQPMLELLPGSIGPTNATLVQNVQRRLASIGSRILGPYFKPGATEATQVYLIMSHDSNQGIVTLENNEPVLRFLGVGRSSHVKYLNQVLADATTAVGGVFVNSPFFAAMDSAQITVHPIGGASISRDGTGKRGSTTHLGELLTGKGSNYHDGIVVVDGSLIPAALAVNPFATITALAERAVEGVAKKKGLTIDLETKNGVLDLFGLPAHPYKYTDDPTFTASKLVQESKSNHTAGVEFTEVMSGYIHLCHDEKPFVLADQAGKAGCESARFFLSARSWNIETLISDDAHEAMLTGTFTHGALPASPYLILRGKFQLFNEDQRTPDTRNLSYDCDLIGTDGSMLHFHGYKVVTPAVTASLLQTWRATSTLYVTLTKPSGSIEGRGILHIQPSEFGAELSTFTSYGGTIFDRLRTTGRFLSFFSRQVINAYLGPFGAPQWPSEVRYSSQNKADSDFTWRDVKASDGVDCVLKFWRPASGSEAKKTPILMVPGASVDHQIFAMPTLEKNAVQYFTEQGYPVYVVTHRVGKTIVAKAGWTTYDARLDVKAAVERIRKLSASQGLDEKVYIICHCAGSVATAAGLLDDTIPSSWVKGITASNVFFTPIFATVNRLKNALPVSVTSVYSLLAGSWFDCSSWPQDTLVQRILNNALRFYPVGQRDEICNSVVCHRSELVFGRLWTHRNLNGETHAALERFLGGTSMASLAHLIRMGLRNEVCTNLPYAASLVTPANLQRLKGIPIFLFSGAENAVYTPENTSKSYSILQDTFGPDLYTRKVFPGKGHLDCWMGQSAIKDVWPSVLDHVEDVCAGVYQTA